MSPEPTVIRSLNVEVIRLDAERALFDALDRSGVLPTVDEEEVRGTATAVRRDLVARSVLLSETIDPRLHTAARDTLRVLGIDKRIELYQSAGGANASVHLASDDPILIELEGPVLANLGKRELAATLGHELGHHLAHGCDNPIGLTRGLCWNFLGEPTTSLHELMVFFAMATELTADRFALLACQNIDAMLRAQMMMTSGLPLGMIETNTKAYLVQCYHVMSEALAAGEAAQPDADTGHPEHNLRAYAAWLFSESDVYFWLTGKGQGVVPIRRVEYLLGKLLRDPCEQGKEDVGDEIERSALPSISVPNREVQMMREKPPPRDEPERKDEAERASGESSPDSDVPGELPVTQDEISLPLDDIEPLPPEPRALDKAAAAAGKHLSRLTQTARDAVARRITRPKPAQESDQASLDDERYVDPFEQDLIDRFEKLERENKDKS